MGPVEQLAAIVLGTTDYGEADRVVRLLTPERGRLAVLARNARRSKRRFAGALEPGNRVMATLRPGRGELWHLDRATLEAGRPHARQDLARLGLLLYATELCGALAREHHAEPRLFGLLDTALILLDAMTGPPGTLFRLALEAKALTFAGVAPVLDRCSTCGEPPDAPMVFLPASGGAAHRHCQAGGQSVSIAWLEAVERARRTRLRELIDLDAPAGPPWALAQAAEAWLHRSLKSREVMASLK